MGKKTALIRANMNCIRAFGLCSPSIYSRAAVLHLVWCERNAWLALTRLLVRLLACSHGSEPYVMSHGQNEENPNRTVRQPEMCIFAKLCHAHRTEGKFNIAQFQPYRKHSPIPTIHSECIVSHRIVYSYGKLGGKAFRLRSERAFYLRAYVNEDLHTSADRLLPLDSLFWVRMFSVSIWTLPEHVEFRSER